MPREIFNIGQFNKGTVTVLDETDQAPDAARESLNIDPLYLGGLRGRKSDVRNDVLLNLNALRSAHVLYSPEGVVKYTTLLGAKNQDGTQGNITDALTFGTGYLSNKSIVERRGELIPALTNVRVCGKHPSIDADLVYFGGQDYAGQDIVDTAEVPKMPSAWELSGTTYTTGTSGQLAAGKYFYRASVLYDGLQDGPLGEVVTAVAATAESYNEVRFDDFKEDTLLYRRATAIRVWRAFSTDSSAAAPDTPYRLIATVDRLKTDYPTSRASVADTIVQGSGVISVFDNGEDQVGDEYERISGISSAATSSFVQYRLGCLFGGSLFVGHCTKEGVPEAEFLLFRSLVGRLDTFDWANEYLRLPYVPRAITGYEGRLYVFSDHHILRINPIGFYIEDQIEQTGTYSPRSVLSLDGGMVFCNAFGAYMYDGKQMVDLSTPIADTWQAWTASSMQVIYLPEYTAVMFLRVGLQASAWIYSFASKRWDYWTFPVTDPIYGNPVNVAAAGAFADADGKTHVVLEGRFVPIAPTATLTFTRLYQISAGTTRLPWAWRSPWMGLGEPTQEKKYYDKQVDAAGTTPIIGHELAGSDLHSAKGFKLIRFVIAGDGLDEVRSVNIMYRRMEGKR